MPSVPTFAIACAALVFIALSAVMNSMFLSSLGRTGVETGLLAALSLAADVAKATLPIVLVRAIRLRAFGQVTGAALMLLVVIALSFASGIGFAALTRGASTAARDAERLFRSVQEQELRDIEARLALMPIGQPVAVLQAELARSQADRRWDLSKSCTEITSSAIRQFCASHLGLSALAASGTERDRLATSRAALVDKLASSPRSQTDSDPQAAAMAEVLSVDASILRRWLSVALAVTLELGSVILVLLLAGPAVLAWGDPDKESPPAPARLPQSSDVARWRRQQAQATLGVRGHNDNI